MERLDEAIAHFQDALKFKDDNIEAHGNLADALKKQGRFDEAIPHYYNILEINSDDCGALNNLAWLRATCPKSAFRDGIEAVKLAEKTIQLTNGQEPATFDTLAAAYAEEGRFPEAVQAARSGSRPGETTEQQAAGRKHRDENAAL